VSGRACISDGRNKERIQKFDGKNFLKCWNTKKVLLILKELGTGKQSENRTLPALS
jgi:hypothetical protein